MRVVCVIRGFGPGGLTSAVLDRASLLTSAGHDASVVAMSFIPDFDAACARLVADGRADPRVPIISPFRDLSTAFDAQGGYLSALEGAHDLAFGGRKTTADGLVREFGFTPAGERALRVLRDPDDSSVVRVDRLDSSGALIRREQHAGGYAVRVSDYVDGARVSERYLSRGGFCYLRRELDVQSQELRQAWIWLPQRVVPTRVKDDAGWHRSYLTMLARRSDAPTVFLIEEDAIPYDYLPMNSDGIAVVPVVHASHESPDVPSSPEGFARIGEFPAVVFLTRGQAEDALRLAGDGPSARVIPNYVPAVDHPVSGTGDDPTNQDVVLVGRLVSSKRVDDALTAFALVVAEVPAARLHIYGGGPEQDALERLAEALGIRTHVEFHGHTTQVLQHIADARLSIMTSEHEGFGLVIVESLAVGTPVVAMDCKYGPRDLILDGVTGFVVDDRDIRAFSERIRLVLTDDGLRRRLSSSGRQWVAEHLSGRRIAAEWDDLLASLG